MVPVSPIDDTPFNISLKLSDNASPTNDPFAKSRVNNRFFSGNATPKSHLPSPTKRFSKSRLNTENRDYSNLAVTTYADSNTGTINNNNNYYYYNTPVKSSISGRRESNASIPSPSLCHDFEELSLTDTNDTHMPFFKQPMLSPIENNPNTSPSLFESPISRSQSSLSTSPVRNSIDDINELPLEMKIICNSRAEHSVHTLDTFVNENYAEFWNLTSDEAKTYKAWNKAEFDIQSLIFEVFTNLKKIRFNLKRLIFIYGAELRDTGVISEIDYSKTFEVLLEFYYFLDKLITKKLKPNFDNRIFVNDDKILKILTTWFNQLNSQYSYISGSIVFLSTFASNEDIKNLIMGISKKDLENSSNRSAVSPMELFNSYFIKLFTSIELLFDRLKATYKDSRNFKNFEMSNNLQLTVKKINSISDSTSELEKKISFNEKLTFQTEIDYSRFQMIDMFNGERKSREPIKLEMKNNLLWSNTLLTLFDNYLIFLTIKSNTISLNRKDEYILVKPPIPIQYLQFDSFIENNYKIVVIKDIGNKESYHFRKINDVTVAILDKFLKDLQSFQLNFWKDNNINKNIDIKFLNTDSFISKSHSYTPYNLNTIPDNYNLLKQKLLKNQIFYPAADDDSFEPILTEVLSCDYFTYKASSYVEKLCIVGTTYGIFMGKINDYKSYNKVHNITNVRKLIIINNEIVFFIANESLYRISIEKLYKTYKYDLPPCDINVFQENKRYVTDFTIGYQSSLKISGAPYLFAWNNKLVYYTELKKENDWKFNWQSFKTYYSIVKLQTVYANNFAVGHIIENCATWNLSKLTDIRSIGLNQYDIKDILKGETPVGIFPFPNKKEDLSEVLVVYSKFFARMKNVKGKYQQSCDEITWLGMQCESASFDCEEKVLITVNKQCVEIRCLFDDHAIKSQLIGCLVGSNITLLNDLPGKAILKAQEFQGIDDFQRQVIFKIKRCRNSCK